MKIKENSLKIQDAFWGKYKTLVKDAIIPYQYNALTDSIEGAEPSHAIENFKIAAGLSEGKFAGMVFQDSDVAKWLEAVGFELAHSPDPELEAKADEVIDYIEKAQLDDGYLNTYFILNGIEDRWTNVLECHELYCAGHMMEAAVAYYKATGKRKLLDVMCRYADHIDTVFGPEEGKIQGYPGHQEVELALVKLYNVTGNEKYLNLAKYFIDERGAEPYFFDVEHNKRNGKNHFTDMREQGKGYNQSHAPVREQTTVEGHSVRAVYMYTAMADIARETGDETLMQACRNLWDNMAQKRMYITGGIGSSYHGEAFTFDYDLPNDTVYAETCASIGLAFFAKRMIEMEHDSRYADVMEKAIYNNVLAGVSLDGKHFFYVNPLEVWPEACAKDRGKHHVKPVRQKWFGCACCPPNVTRLLASLEDYIYSIKDDTIFVDLYAGTDFIAEGKSGSLNIVSESGMPWNGNSKFTVKSGDGAELTLAFRIPEWSKGAVIKINGENVAVEDITQKGYVYIKRVWQAGDVVEVKFDMPVRVMRANPKARADVGYAALQMGPIVYCIEEADNSANLQEAYLDTRAGFEVSYKEDLLEGINTIKAHGYMSVPEPWQGELYSEAEPQFKECEFTFIPYYAWANRDEGEMQVWVKEVLSIK